MARGRRPNYDLPPDPQTLYITAVPHVPIRHLVEMYAGRRGCSLSAIQKRSIKEGWVAEREAYQAELRLRSLSEIADDSSLDAVMASRRHVDIGKRVWALGANLLAEYGISKQEMDRDKALRVATQILSKGVDIERKGLGLADKVVRVVNAEEITIEYIKVVKQRLMAYPDLAADLVDGFREHLKAMKLEIAKDIDLETMGL